jgi:type I restriction enzyme, S subunit
MSAERLLAYYERIADAPDAVQRLRRFVLNLAVRGKLVGQDPKDEPASALLKRRKIAVSAEELFQLPPSWVWVNVGAVAEARLGKMLDRAKNRGAPRRYLRNVNVRWFDFDMSDLLEMRFEESELPEFALRSGDVLICEGGEPGRAAVWDERESDIYFQKAIHRVRFLPVVDSAYFVNALRASADDGRLAGYFTGTGIKHFTGKGLDAYVFPLPPIAEQRRIVAKVDDLMALCDRLETARAAREVARNRLATASLARLNAPDPQTFHNDASFALSILPALTTRPDQMRQLRRTILTLAVRGKLVPQDPKDEPAPKLLKRIAVRRTELLRANYPNEAEARTQIRKAADQSIPETLEKLPVGWAWATLLQCSAFVIDCKNKTAPYSPHGIKLVRTTNVRDGKLNQLDQKYVSLEVYQIWSARAKPAPGDILITREAPMGEVCLIPEGETLCLGQRMMLCRLVPGTIDSEFMIYSLRDPNLMDRVQDKPIGATVQHLRVGGVESLLVPLPPLAEQRRIVAKVDELMALCDRLEASLSTDDDTRRRLLDALLAEALAPTESILPEIPERIAAHA